MNIKINRKKTKLGMLFRRDLKKIEDSKKSGAGAEDIYTPSLWYFSEIDFLKDQEEQMDGITTMDLESDMEEVNLNRNKVVKQNRTRYEGEHGEFLRKAVDHLEGLSKKQIPTKDDAAVYADSWAVSFRKLSEDQQLFAKKAIEDILIMGQLKQLTLDTVSLSSSTRTSTPITSSSSTSSFQTNVSRFPILVQVPTVSPIPVHTQQAYKQPDEINKQQKHQQIQSEYIIAESEDYSNIVDLFSDSQYC